jgi:hypothetical protein
MRCFPYFQSFVKDLIVEPELGEADFIKDEREDSDWSLFLQDNKTLEQIDKDVRRTLPDFAFFQLPIPYSPHCPLSMEPGTRKQPKQHKQPVTNNTKTDDIYTATTNSSSSMINPRLAESLESTSILETRTPPGSIPNHQNYTNDPVSMLSRSLPKSELTHRKSFPSGGLPSHLDLRTSGSPNARSMTPTTMKRRLTVTLMSPRAEKKPEKSKELDSWPIPNQSTEKRTETPPLANGFRTPTNNTAASSMNGVGNSYSSPVPSKLRGMASILVDSEGEDDKPTLPDYLFSPIPTRRSLFKRVAHLNQDFGSREHQPHTLQASRSQESWIKKRKDMLSNGRKTAEAAAAAMATTASPIDVPLSSSPESVMEDPQIRRRRAQKNRCDDDSVRGDSESGNDEKDEDEDEDEEEDDELPQDLHWEAIERILFIYAKLNPGVGYVQGMNEILGPLYYLFANDPDEVNRGTIFRSRKAVLICFFRMLPILLTPQLLMSCSDVNSACRGRVILAISSLNGTL